MLKQSRYKARRCGAIAVFVCVLFGVAQAEARASSILITVTEAGGPSIPILDNGPFDTDPTAGRINVNPGVLNVILINFQFAGLHAVSNSPGAPDPAGAFLTIGGEVLTTGALSPASITIDVSDTDYTLPVGSSRTLFSSASATFTAAPAGNSQDFTSWYNASNVLGDKGTPSASLINTSTGVHSNSHGANAPGVMVGNVNPYGLTNETVISLSPPAAGQSADLVFGGSTQISDAPIPEPATLLLCVGGFSGLMALRFRRSRVRLG